MINRETKYIINDERFTDIKIERETNDDGTDYLNINQTETILMSKDTVLDFVVVACEIYPEIAGYIGKPE